MSNATTFATLGQVNFIHCVGSGPSDFKGYVLPQKL